MSTDQAWAGFVKTEQSFVSGSQFCHNLNYNDISFITNSNNILYINLYRPIPECDNILWSVEYTEKKVIYLTWDWEWDWEWDWDWD